MEREKLLRFMLGKKNINVPHFLSLFFYPFMMDVSEHSGFSPQITSHFHTGFPLFSPSILGYPYVWKLSQQPWLFRKDTEVEVDIERHDVDEVFRIVPDEDVIGGALHHLGKKSKFSFFKKNVGDL